MTIALIAHDSKKELMVQFCMAYRHILEQHRLLATGTTGRLVEENAGLKVTKFLPGGHGGAEQIVARIACEEVDMLLFFRDPISAKPSEPNEMNLLRICDVHNVPVATNIAAAEVLIHGWSTATSIGARSSIRSGENCTVCINLQQIYNPRFQAIGGCFYCGQSALWLVVSSGCIQRTA